MTPYHGLTVREMQLGYVELRINYFHDASDDHLTQLGVDRALLPCLRAWREFYETDQERPIAQRLNSSLVWELDREPVGFSTTDDIVFGQQAFMRLHSSTPSRGRPAWARIS
jgi:hypothetical protein